MKIEKLNDHQIRCTLTRADLEQREIQLTELAYGSEKTKSLFRDMMQQAFDDFGFEADSVPLMIEAIPLSTDVIVLIISKVDSPDELDTRFSRFTQALKGNDDEESEGSPAENTFVDLDELFKKLGGGQKIKEEADRKQARTEKKNAVQKVRLFSFDDLDTVISLSRVLNGFYRGENTIYRDKEENLYHLVLRQSDHSPSEFNRVSHLASEYLTPERYSPGSESFFREHHELFLEDQALQTLAAL